MIEQGREIEQAVSALTAELLKLSPLQGDELANLNVTLENAISRLALAILAKMSESQEESVEQAVEAATA